MLKKMFLTTEDLEKKYKFSKTKIIKLRKKGLPTIKLDRSVRFDEIEVDNWIISNSNKEEKLHE